MKNIIYVYNIFSIVIANCGKSNNIFILNIFNKKLRFSIENS